MKPIRCIKKIAKEAKEFWDDGLYIVKEIGPYMAIFAFPVLLLMGIGINRCFDEPRFKKMSLDYKLKYDSLVNIVDANKNRIFDFDEKTEVLRKVGHSFPLDNKEIEDYFKTPSEMGIEYRDGNLVGWGNWINMGYLKRELGKVNYALEKVKNEK